MITCFLYLLLLHLWLSGYSGGLVNRRSRVQLAPSALYILKDLFNDVIKFLFADFIRCP